MTASSPPHISSKQIELSGVLLEKTVKMMRLSFSRVLLMHPEIDVTVDQWLVISLLQKHKILSQQEICEIAFKDAPTVTRMIDLLVVKNIVYRNIDTTDRRKFLISLTPDGIDTFGYIAPLVKSFRSEAFSDISSEELIVLERVMNKIFDNLSKSN
jgi:DNA-binding MarR family transcriptional regulator